MGLARLGRQDGETRRSLKGVFLCGDSCGTLGKNRERRGQGGDNGRVNRAPQKGFDLRVGACHAGGREFESRRPRQRNQGVSSNGLTPLLCAEHAQQLGGESPLPTGGTR